MGREGKPFSFDDTRKAAGLQKISLFVYGRLIYYRSHGPGPISPNGCGPGSTTRPRRAGSGTHHPTPVAGESAMADMSHLTERQRQIYDFIKSKIENRGYGPTVREIGEGFGIQS